MQQLYRKLDLEYVLLAGKEGKKKGRGGNKGGEMEACTFPEHTNFLGDTSRSYPNIS